MKNKLLSLLGALAVLMSTAHMPAVYAQTEAPPEPLETTFFNPASAAGALANCKESLTPVAVPAGIIARRIAPSATSPGIVDPPDCPHYVALSTTARRQPELFVFLPGTNLEPLQFKMLVHQAAENGFYAIGLSYQNLISENEACSKTLLNLPEDPQCPTQFREEVIAGVNASSVVTVTQANSIVGRLASLIAFLNVNDPGNNWSQFLQPDGKTIAWSKIRLGGHSQGSGHSALIATRQQVARVCMFSGPGDNAIYGLNPPPSGSFSTIDVPIGGVTTTLYTLPPTWVTASTATPAQRMFSFSHDGDRPLQPRHLNYQIMGLTAISGTASVDGAVPPYGDAHVLTTTVPITRFEAGPHGSTAKDDDVPIIAGPAPLFAPVWQYTCFDNPPNPEPAPEPCKDRCPDLGDAPDSNNSLGNVMSIHPFGLVPQPAFYPTEFTGAAGTGPIHLNAGSNPNYPGVPLTAIDSALGLNVVQGNLISRVSNERNAFLLPDQDTRKRNIIPAPIPANGRSNRDGFDNAFVGPAGNRLPVKLQACQPTSITYSQFIHAPWAMNGFYAGNRYINVWVDLNRDGDWADTITAQCQGAVTTSEWLVRDALAPNASGVFALPAVNMTNITDNRPLWLRISISDSPAPAGSIGNGPAAGYRFGETEDHILCYRPALDVWTDCPAIKVEADGAEIDGEFRINASSTITSFPKPITLSIAIEEDALYPVEITWTIDGDGVQPLNANVNSQSVQAADGKFVIKQTIPSVGIATQPVILGWYGCITCTVMSAASASSTAIGLALPPPGTVNVKIADASGFEASETLIMNIGWRVFVPVTVRKEDE